MINRDTESEVTMTTSLDALFAENDSFMVSDDSDSDGYLSEVKDLPIFAMFYLNLNTSIDLFLNIYN